MDESTDSVAATTERCVHCGRPLRRQVGLDEWKADTGLVTCFDAPDRLHRTARWGAENGSEDGGR